MLMREVEEETDGDFRGWGGVSEDSTSIILNVVKIKSFVLNTKKT